MNSSPPVRKAQSEAQRIDSILAEMNGRFGVQPDEVRIVRSPLRICPLGAHIDHQLGVVTGMTIDQSLLLAFAPCNNGQVCVQSSTFDNETRFDLDDIPPFASGDWGNYVRGAALALRNEFGLERGLNGFVESDMPVGGLSSSAAVTVAYLLALQHVNDLEVSARQNIRLVSRTEQDYIGLRNGILDQTSILFSQPESLTRIDCQTEEISQIGADEGLAPFDIMVVYSGIGKNLVGAGYNSRVSECQEAATLLLDFDGQSVDDPRLRLVAPDLFDKAGNQLPEIPYRRAAHYFGEMERVAVGIDAWQAGDLKRFGNLMNASGDSSIHLYECGCPQLITLYETLREIPGVIGARFSGAGFRGNCIAFTEPDARSSIAEELHSVYPASHPDVAESYSIHYCQSAGPAMLL